MRYFFKIPFLYFININELINYLKIRDHIDQKGSVLIFNPVPKNKSIVDLLSIL